MPVRDQLPSLASGIGITQSEYDIVQAHFQDAQEFFAGCPWPSIGGGEVAPELPFQNPEYLSSFLLFSQL
jgi:hypothetical protein